MTGFFQSYSVNKYDQFSRRLTRRMGRKGGREITNHRESLDFALFPLGEFAQSEFFSLGLHT